MKFNLNLPVAQFELSLILQTIPKEKIKPFSLSIPSDFLIFLFLDIWKAFWKEFSQLDCSNTSFIGKPLNVKQIPESVGLG